MQEISNIFIHIGRTGRQWIKFIKIWSIHWLCPFSALTNASKKQYFHCEMLTFIDVFPSMKKIPCILFLM
jgi:hypothetical protein